MRILGIDPGKTGGLAIIGGSYSTAIPMPVVGKEIDVRRIREFIELHSPDEAFIEQVAAMPKQGVTSTFTFGKGFGQVLGLLAGLGIPHRQVRPQEWKAAVLKGTKKDKDAAVYYVFQAYPEIDLLPGRKTKAHDGMADAVCIAEYGLMKQR